MFRTKEWVKWQCNDDDDVIIKNNHLSDTMWISSPQFNVSGFECSVTSNPFQGTNNIHVILYQPLCPKCTGIVTVVIFLWLVCIIIILMWSHCKCSVWKSPWNFNKPFKVVDCYFFGTGSPWLCLLTPKRGTNSYLNKIYALYIVHVKCTCSLVPVVLFVQDIERLKLHWIKLLCFVNLF